MAPSFLSYLVVWTSGSMWRFINLSSYFISRFFFLTSDIHVVVHQSVILLHLLSGDLNLWLHVEVLNSVLPLHLLTGSLISGSNVKADLISYLKLLSSGGNVEARHSVLLFHLHSFHHVLHKIHMYTSLAKKVGRYCRSRDSCRDLIPCTSPPPSQVTARGQLADLILLTV